MNLNARNSSAFYQLEQRYLYDIPEINETVETVICDECKKECEISYVKKINGDMLCLHCIQKALDANEIEEEDIAE